MNKIPSGSKARGPTDLIPGVPTSKPYLPMLTAKPRSLTIASLPPALTLILPERSVASWPTPRNDLSVLKGLLPLQSEADRVSPSAGVARSGPLCQHPRLQIRVSGLNEGQHASLGRRTLPLTPRRERLSGLEDRANPGPSVQSTEPVVPEHPLGRGPPDHARTPKNQDLRRS